MVDDWSHPRRRLDRVGVAVSGDGYNGGGAFTFVLAGDKIARMVITGSRASAFEHPAQELTGRSVSARARPRRHSRGGWATAPTARQPYYRPAT